MNIVQLEYILLNYFNKHLDTYKIQFCSVVNVVKSFVIKPFDYHFSNIKNVFNIVTRSNVIILVLAAVAR
ncbi:unnamed protein product [Rotaria sp. Silwood2]|nr:unnamed protein product [Rotaria sp. Silwood2]